MDPDNTVYPNQKAIADQVHDALASDSILYVSVIAQTQSGKTGSMLQIMYDATTKRDVSPEHMFVITGISSNEWKEQTKERFPHIMQKHVFHLKEISTKFPHAIANKQNVLIIIDEMHMAAADHQTISKVFTECSLLDTKFTITNMIQVVEFSATPDGIIRDRLKSKEHWRPILADPGQNYIGCIDLLERGSIRQAVDLSESVRTSTVERSMENLDAYINTILNTFEEPKYHIIRAKDELSKHKIKNGIDNWSFISKMDTLDYDQYSILRDINHELEHVPKRHTFIFIKEMLRCAKTLNKTYIGTVYERVGKTVNDSTIIQGVLGRMTGYDTPDDILIYTNVESIKKYKRLWESTFTADVGWKSNTSEKSAYPTGNGKENVKKTKNQIDYVIFTTRDEAITFINDRFPSWKPKITKGTTELMNYTAQEIADRNYGHNRNTPRRLNRGVDGKWVVTWLRE